MILGIDPGERRVGVAIADEETRFARPLETIDQQEVDVIARLKQIIAEREVTKLVVGRPVGLSGREGPAMDAQKTFLVRLRSEAGIAVDVYDERLTTVIAEQQMQAAGTKPEQRKAMRDAIAAAVMLQGYMDSKR